MYAHLQDLPRCLDPLRCDFSLFDDPFDEGVQGIRRDQEQIGEHGGVKLRLLVNL